jgi:hypothetical protein
MMPYDDSSLDVIQTCEGISKIMHELGLIQIQNDHSADECRNFRNFCCAEEKNQRRIRTCLYEMLVKRKMGSRLKKLILSNDDLLLTNEPPKFVFDLPMALVITENCQKLQILKLKVCEYETGAWNLLIKSLKMNCLETLKVYWSKNDPAESAVADLTNFDLILERGSKLTEVTVFLRIIGSYQ